MKKNLWLLAAAGTFAALTGTASAQNIVNNAGFESGFSGWYGSGSSFNQSYAHSGTGMWGTGCVGHACVSTYNSGSYFGQALSTTAGTSYDLSFWVMESSGPTSEFSVFWNGALVSDVLNFASNTYNNGSPTYRKFSLGNLVASGSSTDLQIHGRQDPAGIYFDDISVMPSALGAVPEPASWAMMMLGFGGVGYAMRRKAKAGPRLRLA